MVNELDLAGGNIPIRELDLRGLKCPLPVLRTRRALRRLGAGKILVVACTDPLAAIDIPHLVRSEGHRLDGQATADGVTTFRIMTFRISERASDTPPCDPPPTTSGLAR